jgi:nucleoside-diphosphate-sugar epimerase
MNIVVKGFSAFIGNNLANVLMTNYNVIGLDRLKGNNTKI